MSSFAPASSLLAQLHTVHTISLQLPIARVRQLVPKVPSMWQPAFDHDSREDMRSVLCKSRLCITSLSREKRATLTFVSLSVLRSLYAFVPL